MIDATKSLTARLAFLIVIGWTGSVLATNSPDGTCLVAPTTTTVTTRGHTFGFAAADPLYPLDYLQTIDLSALVSSVYGIQWSNSVIAVQNGGNLYTADFHYSSPGLGPNEWDGSDLTPVSQIPISPDTTVVTASDKVSCIVDASGNVWSFGSSDPRYPLDYFVLKNGSLVSTGSGLNWSMSRLLILFDGTNHNLYATEDNYGTSVYKWDGSTFSLISTLPSWDPTYGGKGTALMLYQCGLACSAALGSNPTLQNGPSLMTYMQWYGDTTLRADPADRVPRTVRQTAQNRLAKMLTPSANNSYGQNTVEITGEFRQFSPTGSDGSSPNGRGWYLPTNGYKDSSGVFRFYTVNGPYVSHAWTLSDQVKTNIVNMIDDVVAARSTDRNNHSFRTILLHLQMTDNAASYCLGNSNYNLVVDQNFAIMNQVRGIIKREIIGTGIQLVTDLDAEAAAYTTQATGLNGFNCAAFNGSWSGSVSATTQYMIDVWSRYQALSDIHNGEISVGFSSYGNLTAMLDGFLANSLPLPSILAYDVYSNPSGFVSYANYIQAAYYSGSPPLHGFWITETDYTDLRDTTNQAWVTGSSGLTANLNSGAKFPILGINQWQTSEFFPDVGIYHDHTAVAASMNPVAFAYGR